jgi:hypothetical protein
VQQQRRQPAVLSLLLAVDVAARVRRPRRESIQRVSAQHALALLLACCACQGSAGGQELLQQTHLAALAAAAVGCAG